MEGTIPQHHSPSLNCHKPTCTRLVINKQNFTTLINLSLRFHYRQTRSASELERLPWTGVQAGEGLVSLGMCERKYARAL